MVVNHKEAIQVASRLNDGYVWGILNSGSKDWISVKDVMDAELISKREYIEELYEDMPASLPAGVVGGRMMLRYLNNRIKKNKDVTKSLCIRAVCVYPKAVNFEWEDKTHKKQSYVVSDQEMDVFPDRIRQQMDNWKCLLFKISGGRW